jgi:hypothetical protein
VVLASPLVLTALAAFVTLAAFVLAVALALEPPAVVAVVLSNEISEFAAGSKNSLSGLLPQA